MQRHPSVDDPGAQLVRQNSKFGCTDVCGLRPYSLAVSRRCKRRKMSTRTKNLASLKWLTLRECAAQLDCSEETVRTMCLSGKLPYSDFSGGDGKQKRYRVHVDDFQAFLRKRHHGDKSRFKPRVTAIPDVPNLCGM